MRPNFIGIGAPRCGSTWLHDLLQSHPDIYMPVNRKELYFFNRHYDKGAKWYESFFPADDQGGTWRAVGEITPVYMYDPAVPGRVRDFGGVDRFLAILRHPTDRLYSQYIKRRMLGKTSLSFREFVDEKPERFRMGQYSEFIAPFMAEFDRSQTLILVMEEAVKEIDKTKDTLSKFLDVDASRFPSEAGATASNAGMTPDRRPIYLAAHRLARKLRDHDLDSVVSFAHKLGLKRSLVGKPRQYDPISVSDREWLTERYAPEFDALERRLDVDVTIWREAH